MGETTYLITDTSYRAVPVTLDNNDPSSIEAASDKVTADLGRIDILVNNAGIFEAATWDDLDFDLWKRVIRWARNSASIVRTWHSL